jgi:hypothetical protein
LIFSYLQSIYKQQRQQRAAAAAAAATITRFSPMIFFGEKKFFRKNAYFYGRNE